MSYEERNERLINKIIQRKNDQAKNAAISWIEAERRDDAAGVESTFRYANNKGLVTTMVMYYLTIVGDN